MDFYAMKRKQLQQMCKKHGIPANLKNAQMAQSLTLLLKQQDGNPTTQALPVSNKLAATETVVDSVEGQKSKRVKLNPENETTSQKCLEMDFYAMKRKQLQQMCKKHGIPANLKNIEMAHQLTLRLKESEQAINKVRPVNKNIEANIIGIDSVEGHKRKKVKFSPENENEVFYFVATDKDSDSDLDYSPKKKNVGRRKSLRKKLPKAIQDQVVETPNAHDVVIIMDTPVSHTRSQERKSVSGDAELIISPLAELEKVIPGAINDLAIDYRRERPRDTVLGASKVDITASSAYIDIEKTTDFCVPLNGTQLSESMTFLKTENAERVESNCIETASVVYSTFHNSSAGDTNDPSYHSFNKKDTNQDSLVQQKLVECLDKPGSAISKKTAESGGESVGKMFQGSDTTISLSVKQGNNVNVQGIHHFEGDGDFLHGSNKQTISVDQVTLSADNSCVDPQTRSEDIYGFDDCSKRDQNSAKENEITDEDGADTYGLDDCGKSDKNSTEENEITAEDGGKEDEENKAEDGEVDEGLMNPIFGLKMDKFPTSSELFDILQKGNNLKVEGGEGFLHGRDNQNISTDRDTPSADNSFVEPQTCSGYLYVLDGRSKRDQNRGEENETIAGDGGGLYESDDCSKQDQNSADENETTVEDGEDLYRLDDCSKRGQNSAKENDITDEDGAEIYGLDDCGKNEKKNTKEKEITAEDGGKDCLAMNALFQEDEEKKAEDDEVDKGLMNPIFATSRELFGIVQKGNNLKVEGGEGILHGCDNQNISTDQVTLSADNSCVEPQACSGDLYGLNGCSQRDQNSAEENETTAEDRVDVYGLDDCGTADKDITKGKEITAEDEDMNPRFQEDEENRTEVDEGLLDSMDGLEMDKIATSSEIIEMQKGVIGQDIPQNSDGTVDVNLTEKHDENTENAVVQLSDFDSKILSEQDVSDMIQEYVDCEIEKHDENTENAVVQLSVEKEPTMEDCEKLSEQDYASAMMQEYVDCKNDGKEYFEMKISNAVSFGQYDKFKRISPKLGTVVLSAPVDVVTWGGKTTENNQTVACSDDLMTENKRFAEEVMAHAVIGSIVEVGNQRSIEDVETALQLDEGAFAASVDCMAGDDGNAENVMNEAYSGDPPTEFKRVAEEVGAEAMTGIIMQVANEISNEGVKTALQLDEGASAASVQCISRDDENAETVMNDDAKTELNLVGGTFGNIDVGKQISLELGECALAASGVSVSRDTSWKKSEDSGCKSTSFNCQRKCTPDDCGLWVVEDDVAPVDANRDCRVFAEKAGAGSVDALSAIKNNGDGGCLWKGRNSFYIKSFSDISRRRPEGDCYIKSFSDISRSRHEGRRFRTGISERVASMKVDQVNDGIEIVGDENHVKTVEVTERVFDMPLFYEMAITKESAGGLGHLQPVIQNPEMDIVCSADSPAAACSSDQTEIKALENLASPLDSFGIKSLFRDDQSGVQKVCPVMSEGHVMFQQAENRYFSLSFGSPCTMNRRLNAETLELGKSASAASGDSLSRDDEIAEIRETAWNMREESSFRDTSSDALRKCILYSDLSVNKYQRRKYNNLGDDVPVDDNRDCSVITDKDGTGCIEAISSNKNNDDGHGLSDLPRVSKNSELLESTGMKLGTVSDLKLEGLTAVTECFHEENQLRTVLGNGRVVDFLNNNETTIFSSDCKESTGLKHFQLVSLSNSEQGVGHFTDSPVTASRCEIKALEVNAASPGLSNFGIKFLSRDDSYLEDSEDVNEGKGGVIIKQSVSISKPELGGDVLIGTPVTATDEIIALDVNAASPGSGSFVMNLLFRDGSDPDISKVNLTSQDSEAVKKLKGGAVSPQEPSQEMCPIFPSGWNSPGAKTLDANLKKNSRECLIPKTPKAIKTSDMKENLERRKNMGTKPLQSRRALDAIQNNN